MEYNRIVSITGMGGLFELLSSKADGGIVRALEDNSTKFVSSRMHSFSQLESIEVYTVRDNVNLVDVFQAMKASTEALPDANNAQAVKSYFEKVYPDMDFTRVYNSDMKKMVKWYVLLDKHGVEMKLSDAPADGEAVGTAEPVAPKAKPAAEAKPVAAKAAPVKKVNAPRKMA